MSCEYNVIESILSYTAIFGGFNHDEVQELMKYMNISNYSNDEIVFKNGSSPKFISLVLDGEVDLIRDKIVVRRVTPGQMFGEIAVLGIMPYCVTAVAKNDTQLLQMSGLSFHSLSKNDINLFSKFLLNITREICREHYLMRDEMFL